MSRASVARAGHTALPEGGLAWPALSRRLAAAAAARPWWPLPVIIAFQAAVALLTLHNTAFQDEGLYLNAGRQILRSWTGGPPPLENYAFYFSGYPYFYPVIGGLLDKLGGLDLARAFSTLCMMAVTVTAYLSTRRLFASPAALFAAAAYAGLGAGIFVSRLATYDALSLLFLAIATVVALRASASRRPWLALAMGPLLLLAVVAKYAAMLWAPPILALLAVVGIGFQGWRRAGSRLAIALSSLAVSLALFYHFMDKSALHAIVGSTTNRVPIIKQPRLEMIGHVLYMGGVVYAAALLGVVLVFRHHPRLRPTALVLFGASWLAPMYHVYAQEAVSLDKHMAFTLFFAMPLAGYALWWLGGGIRRSIAGAGSSQGLAGIAVVVIIFTLGLQQARALYAGWPNTTQLSYVLHTQMRDGSGRYLVEDIEVIRYDCRNITQPWQWNGVTYFYYVDRQHQALYGNPALAQAIKDDYFALVELSFIYHPAQAQFIAQQMAATRNYDLLTRVRSHDSYGSAYYYIWRQAAVPGHGNYTSVSQSPP